MPGLSRGHLEAREGFCPGVRAEVAGHSESKDTVALDCILAPDFADTSRKGALRPKTQVLQELTQGKEQDQYEQKLTELQTNLFGDTAVVHGINVISDKQGHQILRIRFTDVLHYSDGHWLAVAAQETDESP